MKVYIHVDSEGSACVVREPGENGVYGPWQAGFIREQATREATAAAIGANVTVFDRNPAPLERMHQMAPNITALVPTRSAIEPLLRRELRGVGGAAAWPAASGR